MNFLLLLILVIDLLFFIKLNKNINKELLTSQTTLRHMKEFIKQHFYLLDEETQKTLEKNNFSKKILLELFY